MEFLQVPETPAPEPAEVLEMQEDCQEAQIGTSPTPQFTICLLSYFPFTQIKSCGCAGQKMTEVFSLSGE